MKISRRRIFAVLGSLALGFSPTLGVTQNDAPGSRIILVSGATGTQGGAVARALIERGFVVRGLTRNPDSERARALSALGVEMVRGDFDDTASIDAALVDAYGAYSVQQYRGIGVDAEIRQSKAFADAARRAGVRHFVYSSVLFARLGSGVAQFESKREIEDYIRSIELPYSFIRPASFMSNFEGVRESARSGIYRTPFPPEMARLHIAPRDIGRVVSQRVRKSGQVDWPRTESRWATDRLCRHRRDDEPRYGSRGPLRADSLGRIRGLCHADRGRARAMVHGEPRSDRSRCAAPGVSGLHDDRGLSDQRRMGRLRRNPELTEST